MELKVGQIVASRQGRDVCHWYAVTGLEGERVLLADGEKWPLSAPKRKNPRHITATKTRLPEESTGSDQALKAALRAWAERTGPQNEHRKQGG